MAMRWYVVHTYAGHENKVKKYLETVVTTSNLEGRIGRIVVPTEKVVKMKDGKRVISTKKFLPSYVLVEMEMSKDTRHLVRSIPGVTNFIGPGGEPQPLQESEVERIIEHMDETRTKKVPSISLEVGDNVKVIDGPFSDFNGVVEEVNPERNKVKVMVSIFGRATPLELDVLQVEKRTPTESQKA